MIWIKIIEILTWPINKPVILHPSLLTSSSTIFKTKEIYESKGEKSRVERNGESEKKWEK